MLVSPELIETRRDLYAQLELLRSFRTESAAAASFYTLTKQKLGEAQRNQTLMRCCDKTAFIQLTSVWQRWHCRNKTKLNKMIHWCLWLIFIPFKKKKISVGSLLLNSLDRRTKSTSPPGSKQTDAVKKVFHENLSCSCCKWHTDRVTQTHTG